MIAQHLNWHAFTQPYQPREDDFDMFYSADPGGLRSPSTQSLIPPDQGTRYSSKQEHRK